MSYFSRRSTLTQDVCKSVVEKAHAHRHATTGRFATVDVALDSKAQAQVSGAAAIAAPTFPLIDTAYPAAEAEAVKA